MFIISMADTEHDTCQDRFHPNPGDEDRRQAASPMEILIDFHGFPLISLANMTIYPLQDTRRCDQQKMD